MFNFLRDTTDVRSDSACIFLPAANRPAEVQCILQARSIGWSPCLRAFINKRKIPRKKKTVKSEKEDRVEMLLVFFSQGIEQGVLLLVLGALPKSKRNGRNHPSKISPFGWHSWVFSSTIDSNFFAASSGASCADAMGRPEMSSSVFTAANNIACIVEELYFQAFRLRTLGPLLFFPCKNLI